MIDDESLVDAYFETSRKSTLLIQKGEQIDEVVRRDKLLLQDINYIYLQLMEVLDFIQKVFTLNTDCADLFESTSASIAANVKGATP